jgi:hypothetical protein
VKSSVVAIDDERVRLLNSISLQNAVLCAECDVVSDSPNDHCLVCGSRSLFNISRLLGGMLPSKRATLIDPTNRLLLSRKHVLTFPGSGRTVKHSGRAKQLDNAMQRRLFK